jgi:hypothetical protein
VGEVVHRREILPLGVKLSPDGGEVLCSPLPSSKLYKECSPLGMNEGVTIPPRGQSSPLGENFTHDVKNWPLQVYR